MLKFLMEKLQDITFRKRLTVTITTLLIIFATDFLDIPIDETTITHLVQVVIAYIAGQTISDTAEAHIKVKNEQVPQ